jgi:hypothetical protein
VYLKKQNVINMKLHQINYYVSILQTELLRVTHEDL